MSDRHYRGQPAAWRSIKIDQKFGRWTILTKPSCYFARCLCRCECGTKRRVQVSNLLQGYSRSCGCLRIKHGDSSRKSVSTIHRLWRGIKQRCHNPSNKEYKWYGAKGIKVCRQWRESYVAFRDWCLANGWQKGLQIDRIKNDGPYSPGNCRFVTDAQNKRNLPRNHWVIAFGETKCLADWADDRRCSVSRATLRCRLKSGMDAETAITLPRRT